MKTLVVEDDFTSCLLLQKILNTYGPLQIAVNGNEAVEFVRLALETGEPFDLICMDIMMPGMNGHQALTEIRKLEEQRGIFSTEGAKILMTTALNDIKNKTNAFYNLCDGYLTKPIHKEELLEELHKLKLIA
jgi:two-component system, chemotaxis family, chemotaxis protein CheY